MSIPIKYFSPEEIQNEIKRLNPKKAPRYALITAGLLKQLPKKNIVAPTQIFNAIIRIQYYPVQWKFAQIILIHKPEKPAYETSSYRHISSLSTLSKLFEKLILKRLKYILEDNELIPQH